MPRFSYDALDDGGREVAGVVEAPDRAAAAADLRRRSLFVVTLAEGGGAPAPASPSSGAARPLRERVLDALARFTLLGDRDLAFSFRQLALMTRAGLTLTQALEVAAAQAGKRRLRRALEEALAHVRGGDPLSRALARRPDVFPDLVTSLIVPAEASGELDLVLERLADHLEKRADVRLKFASSLVYPGIVSLLASGVVVYLVLVVLPKFAGFFARRRVPLPPFARLLLDVGAFTQANYFAMAIGFSIAGLLFLLALRTARGRAIADRAMLSLPVFGALIRSAAAARIGRTVSLLLRSGLPLLEALRVTARGIANVRVRARLEAAATDVLCGRRLSAALEDERAIPALIPRVVSVGEETGALEEVLDQVGAHFDRDVESRLARVTAVFEPTLILVVGGAVGFIYYTFIQAVYTLAEQTR